MPKKRSYLLPFILAAAIAAGIFIGGKLNFNHSPERLFGIKTNSKKDKLNQLIDYIDHEYVDNVNTDSIVDVTVNNILEKLDPHSVYIPKNEMQEVNENMKGDFVGVGVSFYIYKDSLSVVRPLEGGPSIKAGILPGDRIMIANGDTLFDKGLQPDDIRRKLKGLPNTPVNLKVYRKSEDKWLDVNIKRSDVPIKSVDSYYMLTDKLGYISINRFAESTYREFKEALNSLQAQGAMQLALDLRDNPGGYLGIAEQIADEFLKDGKLILFTKNKKGTVEQTYATEEGDFEEGEVFVLINENSASASEIIAGALQDNDVGTIVGRRSFGKGLVQREMALPDGSAVRLTISRYYTPTGRSIQRPYGNGSEDYYNEFQKRYTNGELKSADSIQIADSLKFTTPKGKTVYGGGGIIPDEFVASNKTRNQEYMESIFESGIMGYFIFEHLDKDRSHYDHYTEESFMINFTASDDLVNEFIAYIRGENININYDPYRESLRKHIKATIAEQIFGLNIAERIRKIDDNVIRRVMELSVNNEVVKD